MIRAALAWGAVGVYCAGIFLVSGLSHPPGAAHIAGHDKLAHAVAFMVMAGLVSMAASVSIRRWSTRGWAWFGWLFAVVYGATDEIHQRFVPGRSSDVFDLLADAIGASVAAVVFYFWHVRRRGGPSRHTSERAAEGE